MQVDQLTCFAKVPYKGFTAITSEWLSWLFEARSSMLTWVAKTWIIFWGKTRLSLQVLFAT